MEEKPERPRSNLAIAGVYGVSRPAQLREALHRLIQEDRRTRGEYQLTDALQLMVEAGYRFRIYPIQGWHDCGIPETLLQTHRTFLERAAHIGRIEMRGSSTLHPPVYLPDGVVLENAHVGPFVSVGEGTVIRNSQVRHAILHEAVTLEDARVEYALVGGT
jgi:dTDP-glucose pyrophosphorylase